MTPLPAHPPVGDNMIYFCLCRYKSGIQWAPRDPGNMDRKNTIADICSGELPNVVTILECNPVENICNDVTEDIMAECLKENFIALGEKFFAEEIAPKLTGQDAIDWQNDHTRDKRKHERVG